MFDFISFLEDFDIKYLTEGKNIGEGWIGTCCPFCDDSSYHLGFHLKKGSINCWRCGRHTLREYITETFTNEDLNQIIKKYRGFSEIIPQIETPTEEKECELPEECIPLTTRHKRYLMQRGFMPEQLEHDWKIQSTTTTGEYKFRIIIPIFHLGKLVSFQGRDITSRQKEKYKTCYETNIKNYLYGLDYVTRNQVIIVEGVTDVWRLGKGNAVATFGINYTADQLLILTKRRFKRIGILFDNEPQAQAQAHEMAEHLARFMQVVKLSLPKDKDPAKLNKKEVQKVLNFLVEN